MTLMGHRRYRYRYRKKSKISSKYRIERKTGIAHP